MEEFYILGLDVSTKTIGVSLFKNNGELFELTHITPIVKSELKTEELIKKADIFNEFIQKYSSMPIKHILIEEPLLKSNNANTIGTLLRFNGMITKICYDTTGVVPEYISTYEARKNAFPELIQPNKNGRPVLFGDYPKDVDKKFIIWLKVSNLEPNVNWFYGKNGQLKKENFDMSDSYTVGLAFMKMKGLK
jgi:RNase H-fold protein (predicted Holliday junction resolvase)